MMNELLAAADRVTIPQAIDIAFNPGVYRADARAGADQGGVVACPGVGPVRRHGGGLPADRRLGPSRRRRLDRCPGVLRLQAGAGQGSGVEVEPPADLQDEPILDAMHRSAGWLRSSFGSVEVPYGRYFRVGREGGDRSWPVGGGKPEGPGDVDACAPSASRPRPRASR